MSNALFDAVLKEKEPMYDVAVVTDDGIKYLHNENCNYSKLLH